MGELYDRRLKNIIDTCNLKEPEKVPIGVDMSCWAFHYAGTTYQKVARDIDACSKAFVKFFDDYDLDFSDSKGLSNLPIYAFQALGSETYQFSTDGCGITHNQANAEYLGPEVYDLVAENPDLFMNETFPKLKVPAFRGTKEAAVKALRQALTEQKLFSQINDRIGYHMTQEREMVGLYDGMQLMYYAPINNFFDCYRGITNTLTDIRRYKDKVKAACDAIWESNKMWIECSEEEAKQPFPLISTIYHIEPFLNRKQFDDLVWSYLMDGYGDIIARGKKLYIFAEGSIKHLVDRFKELPKGSLIFRLDMDDPFEFKKLMDGNCTIVGGMSAELLAAGTPDQCSDYVKRSFDELAPGGGFLFSAAKELISSKDATVENMRAAYETALTLA